MKLVVGLGNPGVEYELTRHNAGFIVLDENLLKLGFSVSDWKFEKKFDALICSPSKDILFLKPQSFMNNSGKVVSAVLSYYKINPTDLFIVHDDVDLESCRVKKQFAAGSGGHNGVQDIIDKLGSKEFWRLRIGVGRPPENSFDIEDWVLGKLLEPEILFLKTLNLKDLFSLF